VLMAAFAQRRPTRDVDLAARALSGEVNDVLTLIREIVAIPVDDGLVFDPSLAAAGAIRDTVQYSGVRVALPCTLASARIRFHVDVNIGDPIWPEPAMVALPRLLGGAPEHHRVPDGHGLRGEDRDRAFADPCLDGTAGAAMCDPQNQRWMPRDHRATRNGT